MRAIGQPVLTDLRLGTLARRRCAIRKLTLLLTSP